ncbi:U-box domain-containing protein 35 [Amborella trichopoda]|nr:U-box domain-containing protein 35 [Amborella trichopoda]|eukprot:XP_020522480.1 U-box domain-containing protein 35 [Amborella trichopoda]
MWKSVNHEKRDSEARNQLVAVAVDSDKSSQHALKWASDHLIGKGQLFILLHIHRKVTAISTPMGKMHPISDVAEDVANAYKEQVAAQTKELLLPFQCFCSRRGLHCKEVVLDDVDVPKAIVDYIMNQSVDKLVLGASSRNALTRTFKQPDVPTCVSKTAPEFCTVYVIAKGKISSIRPAPRPNKHPINRQPSNKFEGNENHSFQSTKSEPDFRQNHVDDTVKSPFARSARMGISFERIPVTGGRAYENRMNERIHPASQYGSYPGPGPGPGPGHHDVPYHSMSPGQSNSDWAGVSLRDHLEGGRPLRLPNSHGYNGDQSSEDQMRSFESLRSGGAYWSNGSGSSGHEQSPVSQENNSAQWSMQSVEDVNAEVRRLRLELKQTMEMYNTAYKEAVNANAKDKEILTWKMEEEKKIEKARKAEEAALEVAAKEKQRCQVLLDAAEAAKKMAELEASKRTSAEKTSKTEDQDWEVDVRYRKYTIEEIVKVTENFNASLKIGEGGYGPVYKATLDHTLVAIKILRPDAAQGRKQFQQEVEVLSCIRHPNMVLLLGACPEYGCLVYEYMANGSLEDCLFRRANTPTLSWQLRFKIAAEIATGLLFLHQTKPEPLVHRDLKPGNILLDHNFVSKISDVGLARLVPPSVADSVTQYRMTAAAGTFCYIDPEYQKTGMLGIKSDVYALGIILLQLISSKPPMGLAHNMERSMEKGSFGEMLDPTVKDWPMEDTMKFARLALRCAELRRKDRPDLGGVVLPELCRLRTLADEKMPQMGLYFHHTHAMSYQEVINVPSTGESGFLNDNTKSNSSASGLQW